MTKKIVINKPLAWTQSNLSESVKSLYFEVDEDNNIKATPVIPYDPTGDPTNYGQAIKGNDQNGVNRYLGVLQQGSQYSPTVYALPVNSLGYVYNILNGILEPLRTPTTFKTATCAAAPATTDIWSPGAGAKFRVMGGFVTMSGLIAAAATRKLSLVEETAGAIGIDISVTVPVLGFNLCIPFDLRPNGYLATTANKKLQVTTSGATYTTGGDQVTVWGTLE